MLMGIAPPPPNRPRLGPARRPAGQCLGAWLVPAHQPPSYWLSWPCSPFLQQPCPHFTEGETEATITYSLSGPCPFPTLAGVAWPQEGCRSEGQHLPRGPPCPRLWQREGGGPTCKDSAALKLQCVRSCEERRASPHQGRPLTGAWAQAEIWRASLFTPFWPQFPHLCNRDDDTGGPWAST